MRIATIPRETIGVIAPFSRRTIEDTVTAARQTAVAAAERIGEIGIPHARIAFLPNVDCPVTAGEENDRARYRIAGVGKGGVVEGGFALLAEQYLHDAVAAPTEFEEALGGASVEILRIAVIALLRSFPHAVPTELAYRQPAQRTHRDGLRGARKEAEGTEDDLPRRHPPKTATALIIRRAPSETAQRKTATRRGETSGECAGSGTARAGT